MRFVISLVALVSVAAAQGNDGYATQVSIDSRGTTYISYVPLTTTYYPVATTLSIIPVPTPVQPRLSISEPRPVISYTTTIPAVAFSTPGARVTYVQPAVLSASIPTVPYAANARETAIIAAPINVQAPSVAPPTPARGSRAESLPAIGFGTWQIRPETGGRSVSDIVAGAIVNGYRHIDCAYAYGNQVEIGAGIREGLRRTGLAREDLWITSKLWNNRHGNEEGAIRETLSQLGLDYLDLFLVHWPLGNSTGATTFDYINVWRGMERLVRPTFGTRYIGISNFSPSQVEDLLRIATIQPKTHQIEVHPYLPQTQFIETHKRLGITVTGYSPLANTNPVYGAQGRTAPPLLENVILKEIGIARGCTAAQVSLAWNLKRGVVVIPKSVNDVRQKENIDTYKSCFLTDADMAKIEQVGVKARFNTSACRALSYGCFSGLEMSPA